MNASASARRRLLKGAGAWVAISGGALLSTPGAAAVDEARAFAAASFGEAWAALGGLPTASTEIGLELPAVADNGAVVPVTVSSRLPGTREILIVVDGNPQPVAARFSFPPGTEPFVSTRIRLAGNGSVVAAVRTDTGLHAVGRAVKVTVGGCG